MFTTTEQVIIVKSNFTIAVYTHIYKHMKYTSQNYSDEYIPVVKQQVWWTLVAILFFSGGKSCQLST